MREGSYIRDTAEENDGATSTASPTFAPITLPNDDAEQGMGGPFGMVASMVLLLLLLVLAKPVKIPAAAAPSRLRTNRSAGRTRDGASSLYDAEDDSDAPTETPAMRKGRIDAALAVQRVVSVGRYVTTLGEISRAPTGATMATPTAKCTHDSGDYAPLDESPLSTSRCINMKSTTPNDPSGYSMLSSDDSGTEHRSNPAVNSSTLEDDDGTNNPMTCCCICLESYQVGDVVAWSRSHSFSPLRTTEAIEVTALPTSTCLHVFHKDCIVQWLQTVTHDDCPSCRTVLLPSLLEAKVPSKATDTATTRSDLDMEQQDTDEGIELPDSVLYQLEDATSGSTETSVDAGAASATSSPLAFVIINGLIARVRRRQKQHQQHRQQVQQCLAPRKVPSCPKF